MLGDSREGLRGGSAARLAPARETYCDDALLALLDDIDAGAHKVDDLQRDDYRRARELCDQYADVDIGRVAAAVLAITERLREPKLATLDRRHFGMLRPRHVAALQLLPEVV